MKKGNLEKVSFCLKYQDGTICNKFDFEIVDLFDLIAFADSKLEQSVWGAKINMEKEELRKWIRLDATTYRADYGIPKDAMEARFEQCKSLLVSFLEENSKSVETNTEQKKEMNEGEEFFG